jgi:enoyl reductase-like protein
MKSITSQGVRLMPEMKIENKEELLEDLKENGYIVLKPGSNENIEPFFLAAHFRQISDR